MPNDLNGVSALKDDALWARACVDGDPYADRIHVCRSCGCVIRTNIMESGKQPPPLVGRVIKLEGGHIHIEADPIHVKAAVFASLQEAYADSEAMAEAYNGPCLAEPSCGESCAYVHQVAKRQYLQRMLKNKLDTRFRFPDFPETLGESEEAQQRRVVKLARRRLEEGIQMRLERD